MWLSEKQAIGNQAGAMIAALNHEFLKQNSTMTQGDYNAKLAQIDAWAARATRLLPAGSR